MIAGSKGYVWMGVNVAVVTAVLGLGGIAGTAAWIAQALFVIFIIVAVIFFLMGRRPPVKPSLLYIANGGRNHELGSNRRELEPNEG
jgi:uncharacterized membrane protein YtjA (UPF0391 family)